MLFYPLWLYFKYIFNFILLFYEKVITTISNSISSYCFL